MQSSIMILIDILVPLINCVLKPEVDFIFHQIWVEKGFFRQHSEFYVTSIIYPLSSFFRTLFRVWLCFLFGSEVYYVNKPIKMLVSLVFSKVVAVVALNANSIGNRSKQNVLAIKMKNELIIWFWQKWQVFLLPFLTGSEDHQPTAG